MPATPPASRTPPPQYSAQSLTPPCIVQPVPRNMNKKNTVAIYCKHETLTQIFDFFQNGNPADAVRGIPSGLFIPFFRPFRTSLNRCKRRNRRGDSASDGSPRRNRRAPVHPLSDRTPGNRFRQRQRIRKTSGRRLSDSSRIPSDPELAL